MKTNQEKIEVMQAHLAGRKIESCFTHNESNWRTHINPMWDWVNLDYRIAREPRVVWENEYTYAQLLDCVHPTKEKADKNASPDRIRCVKFVEVMEDGE